MLSLARLSWNFLFESSTQPIYRPDNLSLQGPAPPCESRAKQIARKTMPARQLTGDPPGPQALARPTRQTRGLTELRRRSR